MVLHIGNREVADKDTYVVPYRWLNDKSVHLYIASCKWDKLVVDLSEEIPNNCLKYVRLKCNEVIVNLPDRKLTAGNWSYCVSYMKIKLELSEKLTC